MNNTFDIKRFGLLLQKDFGEYFIRFRSKMGALFAVYAGIILYAWLAGLIFDTSMVPMRIRVFLIIGLTLGMTISAPSVLYGHVNHKLRGIGYAILPVSSLEKFLVMIIMTVIFTPIICCLSLITIDTLLSLLPLNSEISENIFTSENGFLSPFMEIRLNRQGATSMFAANKSIPSFILMISVFLLGNMIFKKNKMSKTILSIVIVWVVLASISMLVYKVLCDAGYIPEGGDLTHWFHGLPLVLQTLKRIIAYSIPALLLFFTYRKIKTQQY